MCAPIPAGAVSAAGVERNAIAGICLGMAGVDRQSDADTLKEALQAWLPDEKVRETCLGRS